MKALDEAQAESSLCEGLVAELSERPGIDVSWINASPEVERVLQRAVVHRSCFGRFGPMPRRRPR